MKQNFQKSFTLKTKCPRKIVDKFQKTLFRLLNNKKKTLVLKKNYDNKTLGKTLENTI